MKARIVGATGLTISLTFVVACSAAIVPAPQVGQTDTIDSTSMHGDNGSAPGTADTVADEADAMSVDMVPLDVVERHLPSFTSTMPPLDPQPLTMREVLDSHPGLLRHQSDNKGPGAVELDSEGVAVISPAPWPDLDQSLQLHHPTVISRVANGAYSRILSAPSQEDRVLHRSQAEWLRDNLVWSEDGVANWLFPMGLAEYDIGPGWASAMTNGFGLAVMLQATVLASDVGEAESFLEAANGVLQSFATTVEEGGVARPLEDGTVCFEEVAIPNDPHCILNGHHFALGGIRVAADVGSIHANALADAGTHYSLEHLDAYDAGFASRYSLTGKYAEPGGYNRVHVNQLLWLYHLTNETFFFDTAAQWLNFEADDTVTITASNAVEPNDHGADKLMDEATWWGYWSGRAERIAVDFTFESPRDVCGIAIYAVGESGMPFLAANLRVNDAVYSLVPDAEAGLNINNSGATSAVAYQADTCVNAGNASLEFVMPEGETLALREIDILTDRSEGAMSHYQDLVKVYEFGRP